MSASGGQAEPEVTRKAEPGGAGRQVFLDWLQAVVDEDLSTTPDRLWHYTSAAGLVGIVGPGKEKLFATNTAFLNDRQELAYGVDLVLGTLQEIDTSGLQQGSRDFLAGLTAEDCAVVRRWLGENLTLFVTCFCEESDLLSQWRAYGEAGVQGGYAIGLGNDRGPAQAWVQSVGHGLDLRRVIYDEVRQVDLTLGLLRSLLALLDANPGGNQSAFARGLVDGLREIASWCKHPAFAEEKEWRVVYARMEDNTPFDLKFRAGHGVVIPYVELPLHGMVGNDAARLPIREIKVGPVPDLAMASRGVDDLLKNSGRANVPVTASLAPLRH